MPEPILSVRNLNVKFSLRGQTLHAIRDVSLDVMRGESLAIVGESGSGKSVFVKSFMGLNDKNGWIDSGEILYEGKNLAALKSEKEWGAIRGGEIAMVMQDPMTSLNPLMTIGAQILEAIELHQRLHGAEAKKAMLDILRDVGITDPEKRARQYPHEFSGGMRQRVVIAVAVACKPKILICDEPTTALDVTIQAQILKLIKNLIAKYHLTAIYITHDLGQRGRAHLRDVRRRHSRNRHGGGGLLRPAAPVHVGAVVVASAAGREGRKAVCHSRHAAEPVRRDQGRPVRAAQSLRAEDRLRGAAAVFRGLAHP